MRKKRCPTKVNVTEGAEQFRTLNLLDSTIKYDEMIAYTFTNTSYKKSDVLPKASIDLSKSKHKKSPNSKKDSSRRGRKSAVNRSKAQNENVKVKNTKHSVGGPPEKQSNAITSPLKTPKKVGRPRGSKSSRKSTICILGSTSPSERNTRHSVGGLPEKQSNAITSPLKTPKKVGRPRGSKSSSKKRKVSNKKEEKNEKIFKENAKISDVTSTRRQSNIKQNTSPMPKIGEEQNIKKISPRKKRKISNERKEENKEIFKNYVANSPQKQNKPSTPRNVKEQTPKQMSSSRKRKISNGKEEENEKVSKGKIVNSVVSSIWRQKNMEQTIPLTSKKEEERKSEIISPLEYITRRLSNMKQNIPSMPNKKEEQNSKNISPETIDSSPQRQIILKTNVPSTPNKGEEQKYKTISPGKKRKISNERKEENKEIFKNYVANSPQKQNKPSTPRNVKEQTPKQMSSRLKKKIGRKLERDISGKFLPSASKKPKPTPHKNYITSRNPKEYLSLNTNLFKEHQDSNKIKSPVDSRQLQKQIELTRKEGQRRTSLRRMKV